MLHRLSAAIVGFIFGAIFVFAGYAKLLDPQLFLIQIRGFRILPDPLAAWLALGLPWLEIFCGLAVILGCFRRGGLLLLNACLAVFLAAVLQAWARGLDVECGCFGKTFKASVRTELVVELVLLAMGLWLLRWPPPARAAGPREPGSGPTRESERAAA